jgi:predicted flavoprotein YhiN
MNSTRNIVVIGGGAGGLMAAGRAAENGVPVTILEKMPETGKKLLLTGNSRCNFSNMRERDDFIQMYGQNGRFLYSVYSRFFREELITWLARYHITPKVEEDGRIFSTSEKASDILKALQQYLEQGKVKVLLNTPATEIIVQDGKATGVKSGADIIQANAVILATGGASYPQTGSTGDGYALAAATGHKIVKIRPAAVPLMTTDTAIVQRLQGVSLHDVRVTAYACGSTDIDTEKLVRQDYGRGVSGKKPTAPVIESRRGDLIFTHFGISGPAVLPMSLAIGDAMEKRPVSTAIDMMPDLDMNELQREIQAELDRSGKKHIGNTLRTWVPEKISEVILQQCDIDVEKPGHQITGEEKETIVTKLKWFTLDIKSTLPIEAAMVTAGGISLKEIDPRTMASKLVQGLYFCGEVIDIDAETGGYNLQAAFSTGWVAGESAAEDIKKS